MCTVAPVSRKIERPRRIGCGALNVEGNPVADLGAVHRIGGRIALKLSTGPTSTSRKVPVSESTPQWRQFRRSALDIASS